jgi:hypothetical protein
MSDTAEIEAVLFKRVGDRFVYQAPNPWIFGPTSRYLVTEAQKAALVAIVVPRRPKLRIAIVSAAILLWTGIVATIMWAFSGHNDPTASDVLVMMSLILVPVYFAWVVALQRNLRRMQPIIANAPRTDERITRPELRKAMIDALSYRKSLLLGATWTFSSLMQVSILLMRNGRHPLFSDAGSCMIAFAAILGAALAIYYLYIAIGKVRQRQPAS